MHVLKKILIFLFMAGTIIFLLYGCSVTSEDANPKIHEQISTPCIPYQLTPVTYPWNSNRLLYVLVEGNKEYGINASRVIKDLREVLDKTIQPNDQIIIGWIEPDTLQKSIIINEKIPAISKPDISPLPIFPTNTITNNIYPTDTPGSTSKEMQIKRDIIRTSTATAMFATEQVRINNCILTQWQEQYMKAIDEWENNRETILKQPIEDISDNLESLQFGQEESKSHLFEALDLASIVISSECKASDDCQPVILVFSNFSDYRIHIESYENNLDLSEIDVISVLYNCDYLYDRSENCSDKVISWEDAFKEANARNITFIPGQNVSIDLVQALERR